MCNFVPAPGMKKCYAYLPFNLNKAGGQLAVQHCTKTKLLLLQGHSRGCASLSHLKPAFIGRAHAVTFPPFAPCLDIQERSTHTLHITPKIWRTFGCCVACSCAEGWWCISVNGPPLPKEAIGLHGSGFPCFSAAHPPRPS